MTKKKKEIILLALLLAAWVAFAVNSARCEELPVEVPATITVSEPAAIQVSSMIATDYYFRHELSRPGINAQTSINLSHLGLDIGIWALTPLEGTALGDIDEIDLSVVKTFETQHVDVSVGLVEFFYPVNGAANDREAFISVTRDFPFNPYLTLVADLTRKGSLYGEIGASHTISTKHADVTIGGDIGLMNGHYGNGSDEVQGFGLFASVAREFKGVTISLLGRYDEDSEGTGDYWFGVSLSKNF